MTKLLHIIASPRKENSRTLKVSKAFLDEIPKTWKVDTLDLGEEKLPDIFVENAGGKYFLLRGETPPMKEWEQMKMLIERFLAADRILISTPMWNFQLPYKLKQFIDIIVQPGYLFKITEDGPVGLVKDKSMVIICSSGGDYSSDLKAFNFVETYSRAIFGFLGITEIEFIHAQPTDFGPEMEQKAVEEGIEAAKELAGDLED